MFDSHCHIHDLVATRSGVKVNALPPKLCLMGTSEGDWPIVAEWYEKMPGVIVPCFGLHPWWSGSRTEAWLDTLRTYLESYPNSILGEVGLDKLHDKNLNDQKAVFEAQLDLALELNRPASVHCVQAWGPMFEIFRERTNKSMPPIAFHSFSGKVEMVKTFLSLNKKQAGDRQTKFYFGFSLVINQTAPKTPNVIASIPADRLLLESDMNTWEGQMGLLNDMCRLMATARDCSKKDIVQSTTENACRLFGVEDIPTFSAKQKVKLVNASNANDERTVSIDPSVGLRELKKVAAKAFGRQPISLIGSNGQQVDFANILAEGG